MGLVVWEHLNAADEGELDSQEELMDEWERIVDYKAAVVRIHCRDHTDCSRLMVWEELNCVDQREGVQVLNFSEALGMDWRRRFGTVL